MIGWYFPSLRQNDNPPQVPSEEATVLDVVFNR